jgi:hypothetical protein
MLRLSQVGAGEQDVDRIGIRALLPRAAQFMRCGVEVAVRQHHCTDEDLGRQVARIFLQCVTQFDRGRAVILVAVKRPCALEEVPGLVGPNR